jgi:hypothetical protein
MSRPAAACAMRHLAAAAGRSPALQQDGDSLLLARSSAGCPAGVRPKYCQRGSFFTFSARVTCALWASCPASRRGSARQGRLAGVGGPGVVIVLIGIGLRQGLPTR